MKKSTRLRADVARCCCRGEEEEEKKEGKKEAEATIIITPDYWRKKSQLKAEGRRWGELAGNGTY
jgi:hypothetical protein